MTAGTAMTVNGAQCRILTDPDTPLCYAIRNELGLRGTRYGCGQGSCGACTVLMDGRDRHSCAVTVREAGGRHVTTVEGLLAADGSLGRVQRALLEQGAGQCGFCLSGIVMRIEAGLRQESPDKAGIVAALEGNLCRCGIQPRVLRALDALLTPAAP